MRTAHELREARKAGKLAIYLTHQGTNVFQGNFPVHDRVSRAVIRALKEAHVVLPYTTGNVLVEMNGSQT